MVPVIVAVGTGVALSTYAGARCLYKNPEVFISKKARNDQLAENQEWFDAKSDLYRKSFFRSIGEACGKPSIFPNDFIVGASK